mmetsp:Transcript_85396/g.183007  ORF Transcript_85396/g.183007 Transcript_85396/m.183007 type:complete len:202 (-) Transcript_85396:4075-4680(-)
MSLHPLDVSRLQRPPLPLSLRICGAQNGSCKALAWNASVRHLLLDEVVDLFAGGAPDTDHAQLVRISHLVQGVGAAGHKGRRIHRLRDLALVAEQRPLQAAAQRARRVDDAANEILVHRQALLIVSLQLREVLQVGRRCRPEATHLPCLAAAVSDAPERLDLCGPILLHVRHTLENLLKLRLWQCVRHRSLRNELSRHATP